MAQADTVDFDIHIEYAEPNYVHLDLERIYGLRGERIDLTVTSNAPSIELDNACVNI